MSDFNLFITKYFLQVILFNFIVVIFQKSSLHLLYQKNLLQNFNLATKLFLLAFTRTE